MRREGQGRREFANAGGGLCSKKRRYGKMWAETERETEAEMVRCGDVQMKRRSQRSAVAWDQTG